jgi:O-antigen/teichoic acid export membrane protein
MSEQRGRVLSNTGYLIVASLASKVVGALFVLAIANTLEDELFGTFNTAFSLVSIFAIIADFGLDAMAIREVSRKPSDGEPFAQLMSLRLLISAVVFVPLALIAFLMTKSLWGTGVVLLAGAISIIDTVGGIFYAFFRGVQRMELEAQAQILWRAAQLGIGLAAIYLGFGIYGILLAMLAASSVRLAFSLFYCRRLGGLTKVTAKYGPWLRLAVPFAAFELALSLYINLPVLILFWLKGSTEVGWFSVGYRAMLLVLIVPMAFEAALYPVLAGMDGSGKDMRRAYFTGMRLVMMVTIPAAILTCTLAPWLIKFFGSTYRSTPLAVLAFALPLNAMNAVTRGYLWSANRQRDAAINIAVATGVLVALAIYLSGRDGATGAAVALVAAEGLLLTLNAVSAGADGFLWKMWPHIVAASGALCAAYAIWMFTESGVPVWAIGGISVCVYIAVAAISGGVTKKEFAMVRNSFRPS